MVATERLGHLTGLTAGSRDLPGPRVSYITFALHMQ